MMTTEATVAALMRQINEAMRHGYPLKGNSAYQGLESAIREALATIPCDVCGAQIRPRNVTHYDEQDLAAAQVRAGILHSRIRVE